MSKFLIIALALLIVLFNIIMFHIFYRKYYSYMKKNHHSDWRCMMSKDLIVENVGDWTRWPLGSWYLFVSILKTNEPYDDVFTKRYKRFSVLFLFLSLVSILLWFLACGL